jgi:hypothetical protein
MSDPGRLVVGRQAAARLADGSGRRRADRVEILERHFRRHVPELLLPHHHRDRTAEVAVPRLGGEGHLERRRLTADVFDESKAGNDRNASQNAHPLILTNQSE